jgi:hypothetical protein
VPVVSEIHAALLAAVHAHELPLAVTATELLPAVADTVWLVVASDAVHGAENENVLEMALTVEPPGPSAETFAE